MPIGLNISRSVGRYLLEHYLSQHDESAFRDVYLQFIADQGSHRDINTAWGLADGMAQQINNSFVSGLDQMQVEKWLFQGCEREFPADDQEQHEAVLNHLDLLPPPKEFPLDQALETIASLLSIDERGNYTSLELSDRVAVSNTTHGFL